jgi:hypothetical protein
VPALERLATARFGGDRMRAQRDLPVMLAALVDEMLSADPAQRPTADQVRDRLRVLAGDAAA